MIAITSIDGTLEGMLDERFGRAQKIIVYDPETKNSKVIDNKLNMSASQGAGIQTAQNIVNAGVKIVLTGHAGPNAFRVLNAAGIEAYAALNMTGREAIEAFKNGKLVKLTGADVEGHW
jgi:predicted Fe-Mo cluster-binding NifX family protein